jgi:recombination protein RecA
VLDIAAEAGIIDKSGAWYSYNGQKIGQGRENAKLYLKDNLALMTEVEEKVKALLGVGPREIGAGDVEVVEE